MDTRRDEPRVALEVVSGAGGAVAEIVAPGARGRTVVSGACSRPGRGRSHNEDGLTLVPDQGLYLVADGMGGHRGGETASRLAVEELPLRLQAALADLPTRGAARIKACLREEIASFSCHLHDLDPEMGTTLVAVLVRASRVFIAHLGDSRAYRFRRHGLKQLTRDHTLVQQLVDAGNLDELSASLHPARHALTRFLGRPSPRVDVRSVRVEPGDRLLLCTDGVHGVLPNMRLERILSEAPGPRSAAETMVELVGSRGGRDDATAVVLAW